MPAITSSSPAKTILFGEHAVVYGQPAIAVPVNNLQTKVTIQGLPTKPAGTIEIKAPAVGLDTTYAALAEDHPLRQSIDLFTAHHHLPNIMAMRIMIASTIPAGSGLGSSAALSVALFNALSGFLGIDSKPEEINYLAYEAEKIFHGTPSGIDNTVIAFNAPIIFQRGEPMQFLDIGATFHFMLINCGVSASTAEAVGAVRALVERYPEQVTPLIREIGVITGEAKSALAGGDRWLLGSLMQRNQALLKSLTVSHPQLDLVVAICERSGALGAKLSGGGRGGHVLCLLEEPDNQRLILNLRDNGFSNTIPFSLSPTDWS